MNYQTNVGECMPENKSSLRFIPAFAFEHILERNENLRTSRRFMPRPHVAFLGSRLWYPLVLLERCSRAPQRASSVRVFSRATRTHFTTVRVTMLALQFGPKTEEGRNELKAQQRTPHHYALLSTDSQCNACNSNSSKSYPHSMLSYNDTRFWLDPRPSQATILGGSDDNSLASASGLHARRSRSELHWRVQNTHG
jgi:hypothetical protein